MLFCDNKKKVEIKCRQETERYMELKNIFLIKVQKLIRIIKIYFMTKESMTYQILYYEERKLVNEKHLWPQIFTLEREK